MAAVQGVSEVYLADFLKYYEEEIQGEGLFQRLSDLSRDPVIKHKWARFAALEIHTQRAMEGLIQGYGLKPKARDKMLQIGIDEADAEWAAMSWIDAMHLMIKDFPRFIAEFEELQRIGPEQDQKCLLQVLNHEQTMIEYARREVGEVQGCAASVFDRHFENWDAKASASAG
ncbi:hypothetical protein [Pseudomonas monteilii]|uniref:hypothetical protein n=1 Tax=Pseudomonas monteilii TaxID=76759 RepID=UPI00383A2074